MGGTMQKISLFITAFVLPILLIAQMSHASPLTGAAFRGDIAKAKKLLDGGADVNTTEKDYDLTLLMIAAMDNNLDMAQLLLKYGANHNLRDKHGQTALMHAAWSADELMIQLLLKHGADVHAKSNIGSTALMYASEKNHQKNAQILLDAGIDINATLTSSFKPSINLKENPTYHKGDTALIFAAKVGSTEVVKVLLEAKADKHKKNSDGKTARDYAVAASHKEIVRLLDEYPKQKPKVNSVSSENHLVRAACQGRTEAVRVMLENGFDPNTKDAKGYKVCTRSWTY